MTDEMKEVLKKEGTVLDVISTGSSAMNGVAERINRTLTRMTIVMLVDSGLSAEMWELAMMQATQIHNKVPHKKLEMKSPYLLLHNREPSRKYIYRFGCKAYSLIPYANKRTRKVDPNGELVFYLGNRSSSCLIMNVQERKIYQSSNVVVTESLVFKDKYDKDIFEKIGYPKFKLPNEDHKNELEKYNNSNLEGEQILSNTIEEYEVKGVEKDSVITVDKNVIKEYTEGDKKYTIVELGERELEMHKENYEKEKEKKMRAKRNIRKPKRYEAEYVVNKVKKAKKKGYKKEKIVKTRCVKKEFQAHMCELNENPKTYKEALKGTDKEEWSRAMKAELEALERNQMWKFVKRPKDRKIKYMDSKWVFVKKALPNAILR